MKDFYAEDPNATQPKQKDFYAEKPTTIEPKQKDFYEEEVPTVVQQEIQEQPKQKDFFPEYEKSPIDYALYKAMSYLPEGAQNRIKTGIKKSASAILAGQGMSLEEIETREKQNPAFISDIFEEAVSIFADLPFFAATSIPGAIAGAEGGAITGGAVGGTLSAPFGGTLAIPGATIGATIGGAAGGGASSFAARTLVQEVYREFLEHKATGSDITWADFVERSDRVSGKALKSMIIGGVIGASGATVSLSGASELEKFMAENVAFAAAETAVEGEAPTVQGLISNALLIGGLHASSALVSGIAKKSLDSGRKPVDVTNEYIRSVNDGKTSDVALKAISNVNKEAVQEAKVEAEKKAEVPKEKTVEKPTVKEPVKEPQKAEPVKAPAKEILNSLNPTSTVFTEYTPEKRAELELGKGLTTLDKTMGKESNEKIKIYRGAPFSQKEIVPGDFITTNKQLARDYAGEGNVLEKEVALSDILDDIEEPLGEEYIYRPSQKSATKAIEKPVIIEKTKLPTAEKETLTTPKELKKQKAYILDAADDALKDAKDVAPKDEPYITIDVPNDGTFQVINTKDSIERFIKRARKFPTTGNTKLEAQKSSKNKGTSKRVSGDGVEYYNEFRPRKVPLKGTEKWGYNGSFYTDGKIAVKTEKPPKKLKDIEIIRKSTLDKLVTYTLRNTQDPADIIAEFKNQKSDIPLVHVTSNGNDFVFNADHIDQILTEHPKAKTYTDSANKMSPLVFMIGDEPVAAAMPIQKSRDYAIESRDKFKPLSERDKTDEMKKPKVKKKAIEKPKVKPVKESKPKEKLVEKPKEVSKPKQREDITTQKVSKEHFKTKSTPAETIEHVSREPQELYAPPVYGETAEKVSLIDRLRNKLPKSLQKKSALAKKSWEIRQDYYGKRWGLDMRYKQKWNDIIKKAKLSASDLEDMIFYIEDPVAIGRTRNDKGTGNPFKGKDDSWNDISKRLSPEAKEAVKVVKEHFKEMLEVLNDSPHVKNIAPREFLEQIYVPHFYEGKVKEALDSVLKQKRFSTSNPLANMRKYATFNDALREAGLVPKYRNINDLLNHYDNLMIRVLSNSELAGEINKLEMKLGRKLIARPNNKALYKKARAEGWVEFSDPYLRRRVVGKQDGKPIFATSEANALVHPDIATSLQGIFTKDAYRPESMVAGAVDAYNDAVRQWKVSISPMFHLGALSESLLGAQGIGGVKKLVKDWDVILSDPVFNEFAAESGLKFGIPTDTARKGSKVLFDKTLTQIELEAGKKGLVAKGARKGLQKLQVGSNILFDDIHPRMKMITFNDYMLQAERRAVKKGIALTPEWRKQAGREVARIVNDQFGGQMWELMNVFSNPENLKIGRRLIGYLDWTMSSLRQMGAMFDDIPKMLSGEGTSLRGSLARKYNARYVAYITTLSQMHSYLNTGLTNRKDKDGKPIPNSIYWDYDKAHSTFENKDPKHKGYISQFFHYQLPDIELSVMGHQFNPGRDKNGKRLYSHWGKQFLEVPGYVTDTVGKLYSKSTPFIQFALPFVTGSKPGEGDWKPRGVWKGGKTVPWDGSEPFTLERLGSRAMYLGENLVPFSAGALYNNPNAFVPTWFGTTPVSKGISLTASEKYYTAYYRVLFGEGYNTKSKDEAREKISELDEVLRDNKYNMVQINRKKSSALNAVRKTTKK